MRPSFSEKNIRLAGFTLIELLVVLGIIGIFIAGAIGYYSYYVDDARTTSARQQLESLRTALKSYALENGDYPKSLEPLKGRYITQIPKSPWGTEYEIDPLNSMVLTRFVDSGKTKTLSLRYKGQGN